MIKNFFVITFRNFMRQKFYSLINILGLASGLTCALFIYVWVNDEMKKDKFHEDVDQIYQIVTNLKWDGSLITWVNTPGPLAEEIKASIPDVSAVTRLADDGEQLFQAGENNFLERGYFADADIFRIFTFPVVKGDASNPLPDKSSVVLTEQLALKLFGTEDPIGKTVRVQKKYDQKVTAVIRDVPGASSLQFSFVMPFDVHKEYRTPDWSNADYFLYVKVNGAAKAKDASDKINSLVDNIITKNGGDKDEMSFYMQPFADHYLQSSFENGVPVGGRIKYVKIFSIVAIFILVIACINFMNMATARAANRSKEVGVRKVVGAMRKGLIIQFISESVLLSAFAMAIALSLVILLLPLFNALVSKDIALNLLDPLFLTTVLLIVIITGLLAGSYPAFFLSSYHPVSVLKGTTLPSFSGNSLRRGLVVFQFALTVILVASAIIIYTQINFIRSKNLGYDREAVMTFRGRAINKNFETFRQEALRDPKIKNVARANEMLLQVNNQNSSVGWPGKPADSRVFFRTVVVDYDFLETMGLELVEGRMFTREFNDTSNMVLTERAVEVMGLQNPIGTKITQWGDEGTVIGVVKDIHTRSLHEAIDPIVFYCNPDWTGNVTVRFAAGATSDVVKQLEILFKKYNPDLPFQYSFLDDEFDKLYDTEKVTGSLALGFTFMAIVISGLGLLGLAAYSAERKRKEIGIRKTLGASVTAIVTMMSVDFVKLTLIACVIGCPVAWYLMHKFLEAYAYHTTPGWEVFALTTLAVLVVSVVTVIFQVAKAALANPVNALRSE